MEIEGLVSISDSLLEITQVIGRPGVLYVLHQSGQFGVTQEPVVVPIVRAENEPTAHLTRYVSMRSCWL